MASFGTGLRLNCWENIWGKNSLLSVRHSSIQMENSTRSREDVKENTRVLRESCCSNTSLLNNVAVGVVDIGSAVLRLQSSEILEKSHLRHQIPSFFSSFFLFFTLLFHVGYINLLKTRVYYQGWNLINKRNPQQLYKATQVMTEMKQLSY